MAEVTNPTDPAPNPVPNPEPAPTPAPPPAPATPPPAPAPAPAPEPPPEPAPDAIAQAKADAEQLAASALALILKDTPGVVAELIGGVTIADVQASFKAAGEAFERIKGAVLADLGAAIPGARSVAGGTPPPATPLAMIAAGLAEK